MTNTQDGPGAPPPAPETGGNKYKFVKVSDGEMKTRPNKNAEWEVLQRVEGTFTRVALDNATIGGKPSLQLEVEVKDRDGIDTIISVSADNSVGSCMLAGLVLELAKGDFVSITANRSQEKNEFGHYTSFINGQRWNAADQKWIEIRIRKSDFGDASWKELQDDIFTKIEAHPAHALRERRVGDDGNNDASDFEVYKAAIEAKGWPAPIDDDSKAYHLAWIGELLSLKIPPASFEVIDGKQWQSILSVVGLAKADKLPPILKAIA